MNLDRYGYDERGRPWAKGEFDDMGRIGAAIIGGLVVAAAGISAGAIFALSFWLRS